jgi:hypothetical protein
VAPLEPVLLTTTQVSTFAGGLLLTRASGFFFERDGRLHVVTSRHVLSDEPTGHAPDRIELQLHSDERDLAGAAIVSCPLYEGGLAAWRQGEDSGGAIDVAALEIDRAKLPAQAHYRAFTPEHLLRDLRSAEIGAELILLGYPLGFQDTVHHLPVARHAIIASAFGVRFQRQGCFLTDGRAHRGSSGSPVLMRVPGDDSDLPWRLLGVHSSRMDMGSRDVVLDESLGLNCAWYADILMTLTADRRGAAGARTAGATPPPAPAAAPRR